METVSLRLVAGLVGGVGIAWQLAVVGLALRHTPALERALRDLGLDLPITTRALLATYKWWVAIPLVATVWLLAAIGRASTAPRRAVAAALTALVLSLILQTWFNGAVLAPLRSILQTLG